MKKIFGFIVLAFFSFALLAPLPASALTLDQAKSQGLLGEDPSGYLSVVKPPPSAEVKELMNDINGKRRKRYQEIAESNGTALNAVEQLGGKKAINKTPAGQFVKLPSGVWRKK